MEITDLYGNVNTQDYNAGKEPFSMTFKADVEITNIRISFATATPFYVLVNIGYPSSYITPLNFISREPDVAIVTGKHRNSKHGNNLYRCVEHAPRLV